MVTDGHCKVHQCIRMMGWLGGPSRDHPLLFFRFHPPLLFLEIISISFPRTPSAFVTFHVWLFHKAHSWERHGCFHTESKGEKDQQISISLHSWISRIRSQNLGADVLMEQNLPQPTPQTVHRNRPTDTPPPPPTTHPHPHHSPVFYPSFWPGSKSRAVRPGRYSRNRKASPLHGSAVGTLHP